MAGVVLATHRVHARVVDPKHGPTDQSRALVVQARTLELWNKFGLAEPAIADGYIAWRGAATDTNALAAYLAPPTTSSPPPRPGDRVTGYRKANG
jgi:2-polyprenyl-6-methoxyphenol hydroxylase-like FAD-dependent oxidoreductase